MINAIILAAGYSKRMGKNKLSLNLNEKSIIEHVMDSVLSYNFNDILLIGRDENVLKLSEKRGIKTIFNDKAMYGQSESIKLGVINSCDTDGYMFFTGDQPFIDTDTIRLLNYAFDKYKHSIIVPTFGSRRGSPVIFPKRFRDELLCLQGDTGGRIIIDKYKNDVHFIKLNSELPLLDIDTPEDYKNILNIINRRTVRYV